MNSIRRFFGYIYWLAYRSNSSLDSPQTIAGFQSNGAIGLATMLMAIPQFLLMEWILRLHLINSNKGKVAFFGFAALVLIGSLIAIPNPEEQIQYFKTLDPKALKKHHVRFWAIATIVLIEWLTFANINYRF